MSNLDKLFPITKGLNRRFGKDGDPFQIATRLLEECGELAKEINHFEGKGVKLEKYGEPQKAHLAKEVQDVMRATLYLGMALMFIALPLALGSWWALIPATCILPVMVARLLNEESVLIRELKGYPEYMQKVKNRLIPDG